MAVNFKEKEKKQTVKARIGNDEFLKYSKKRLMASAIPPFLELTNLEHDTLYSIVF